MLGNHLSSSPPHPIGRVLLVDDDCGYAAIIRRQEPAGTRLQILGMTADAGAARRRPAIGMDVHVAKPIEPDELWDAVEGCLLAPSLARPVA